MTFLCMIALKSKTVAHTFLPSFKKQKWLSPLRKIVEIQSPVVQTLNSAIHRINLYPPDSVIDFRNTYPLESDLSGR